MRPLWQTLGFTRALLSLDIGVLGLLCVAGCVGNLLSLLVFSRDKHKNSMVYLLMFLAAADELYLMYLFIVKVVPGVLAVTDNELGYQVLVDDVSPWLWPISCIIQTFSIFVVVMVTVDRFMAITRPLQMAALATRSLVFKAVAVIFALSVILNIPRFFHSYKIPVSHKSGYPIFPLHGMTTTSSRDLSTQGPSTVEELSTAVTSSPWIKHTTEAEEDEVTTVTPTVNDWLTMEVSTPEVMFAVLPPKNTKIAPLFIMEPILNIQISESEPLHIPFQPIGEDDSDQNLISTATTTSSESPSEEILGDNKYFQYVYYIGGTWLLIYAVPLATLTVLNVKLMVGLRSARKQHARLTQNTNAPQKESLSTTLNIIAVVTVFLVCQTPDLVQIIISYDPLEVDEAIIKYSSSACLCLLALNSGINFVIYFLFYKKFRKLAVAMMVCGKKQGQTSKEQSTSSVTGDSYVKSSSSTL